MIRCMSLCMDWEVGQKGKGGEGQHLPSFSGRWEQCMSLEQQGWSSSQVVGSTLHVKVLCVCVFY